jgi:hypothetical protein
MRIDVPVTAAGVMSRTSISGTMGAGGPRLRLRTVNGGISVRRR